MKNQTVYAEKNRRLAVLLLCSLLLFSCDLDKYKGFDYDLQGTWETNSTGEYSGTLLISYDTITINGYKPNTIYEILIGTEQCRPFKDFTKDTLLEGYAEDGKIFIKDAGIIQEGLPYVYYLGAYSPSENKRPEFLRFNFGGRDETLRKQ